MDSNNIYKLIKRAKDKNCNSTDPMKRIIPNPIKFVYSFTLNSGCEPYIDESIKYKNEEKNDKQIIKKQNINNKEKKEESKSIKKQKENNVNKNTINAKNNNNPEENINQKNDVGYDTQKNKNNLNNINKINKQFNKNENFKNKDVNKEKENNFINKKRINDNEQEKIKHKNNNNNSSNVVKNSMIHQIYNSKNINLWEDDDDSDSDNNKDRNKGKKNENILPLHKQIEFIDKCQNVFKKHDVAVKSEYDKDLDKGRVKKVHKNKIGFKKHKNYFQKISNKNINKQKKYNQ